MSESQKAMLVRLIREFLSAIGVKHMRIVIDLGEDFDHGYITFEKRHLLKEFDNK